MSVTEKYIQLVEIVNEAETEVAHSAREIFLDGFRSGLKACGWGDEQIGRLLMSGDEHYIDKGIDRPMCGGVWLDWEPTRQVCDFNPNLNPSLIPKDAEDRREWST